MHTPRTTPRRFNTLRGDRNLQPRGSLSSVGSTAGGSGRKVRRTPVKYNTWNPKSKKANAWKLERPGSLRSSFRDSSIHKREPNGGESNVCVMVRIRPLFGNDQSCLEVLSDSEDDDDLEDEEQILNKRKQSSLRIGGESGQVYTFDRIFDTGDGQEEVFLHGGKALCQSALEGYNASIFAYGQTGSGKTYTMQGECTNDSRGIIPRVLEYCFVAVENLKAEGKTVIVSCSYVEIYNENVFDLLDVQHTKAKQVREDTKRGVFVEGALEPNVHSFQGAINYIKLGSNKRRVGKTNMNRESSRSHSIFTLNFDIKDPENAVTKKSRINLIDLAGSERQRATAATGSTLVEAKHINKSLSALGNVISALVDRSRGREVFHFPYRDSTLTYLLRDSLGHSRLSIIATLCPNQNSYCETLSTIQFAQRVKHIKVTVKANTTVSSEAALRKEIRLLREELEQQKEINKLNVGKQEGVVEEQEDEKMDKNKKEDTSLAKNADFVRLEKSAGGQPVVKEDDAPQKILRTRLGHLERVLALLLQELGGAREECAKLKSQVSHHVQLEQVLQDTISGKELVLALQTEKLNALCADKKFQRDSILRNAKETALELQLRSEIDQLKIENSSLTSMLKYSNKTSQSEEKTKNCVLQVQMEALLDDKNELERIVKKLQKTELKRKQEGEKKIGDNELQEKLQQALDRANKLEEDLFIETERSANLDKEEIKLSKSSDKMVRRRSAGDIDTSCLHSYDRQKSMDGKVNRAVMLVAAEAQKSARKVAASRCSILSVTGQLIATPPPPLMLPTSPTHSESSALSPAPHSSPIAQDIVRKKIFNQLTDTRKHLRQSLSENKRLSLKLQQKSSAVRKMRKSLSAKENNIDTEELKAMHVAMKLTDLQQRYDRLAANNKDLQEAVSMANSFAEYKSKQHEVLLKEVQDLKRNLKKKKDKENRPSNGNKSGIRRFSSLSSAKSSLPAMPRDSNQTLRMSNYETRGPRSSSMSGTFTTTPRSSDGSSRSSSISHASSTRTTKSSVAEFFPESIEAKQIVRRESECTVIASSALEPEQEGSREPKRQTKKVASFRFSSLLRSFASSSK